MIRVKETNIINTQNISVITKSLDPIRRQTTHLANPDQNIAFFQHVTHESRSGTDQT